MLCPLENWGRSLLNAEALRTVESFRGEKSGGGISVMFAWKSGYCNKSAGDGGGGGELVMSLWKYSSPVE